MSINELIVYVVVIEGDLLMVIGLLFPLKPVPSDNVPLQGALPVRTSVRVTFCPLHIAAVPVIIPTGLG